MFQVLSAKLSSTSYIMGPSLKHKLTSSSQYSLAFPKKVIVKGKKRVIKETFTRSIKLWANKKQRVGYVQMTGDKFCLERCNNLTPWSGPDIILVLNRIWISFQKLNSNLLWIFFEVLSLSCSTILSIKCFCLTAKVFNVTCWKIVLAWTL